MRMRVNFNQAQATRPRRRCQQNRRPRRSSELPGEPALDGAECGEAGGVLDGALDGDEAGEERGAASGARLDGDGGVLAAEELEDERALEGERGAAGGGGDGLERGACGGASAAGGRVDLASFAGEDFADAEELDAAGDLVVRAAHLEAGQDEEPSVPGGR